MKKYFKILGFIGFVASVVILLLYLPQVYAASDYEWEHGGAYSAFIVLGGLSEQPSRILGAAISMLITFVFHFIGFVFSIIQMKFVKIKSLQTNLITGVAFLFSGIGQIVYFTLWMIGYSALVVMALINAVLFIGLACFNIVPVFVSFFKHLNDE